MPMNIEPTLKAKIDSTVKIARATFATDCSEEEAIAACLRTYVDRGLAKMEFDPECRPTFVETELEVCLGTCFPSLALIRAA